MDAALIVPLGVLDGTIVLLEEERRPVLPEELFQVLRHFLAAGQESGQRRELVA